MSIRGWLLGVALFGLWPAVAVADKPGNAQEEKAEDARERAAKAQVQAATEKAQAAQRAAQAAGEKAVRAKAEHQAALQAVAKMRTDLERKHESGAGVTTARKAVETAQADLDRLAAPVLAALREGPEHRAAVTAAETARTRLRSLGASAPASEKAAINQATLVPARLEREALDADPRTKAAAEKLAQAHAAVKTSLEKRDRLVDADPALKKAHDAVDVARKAGETTARDAAREAQEFAAASQKLAQERSQLAQLQRSEAADDARDKQAQQNDKKKKANKNKKK